MLVALFASCEDVQVAREPPRSRIELAADALQLTIDIERLRPMARALGKRSFEEDTLDDLQRQLGLVRDLLSDDLSTDPRTAQAAAVALLSAGIKYDLIRTDLEATARGFAGAVRSNCNRGVEATNLVSKAMDADWRWPLEHPDEADQWLGRAATFRNNVMAAAEVTSVAKPAVGVASMASTVLAVDALVKGGPALARIAAWLRGAGGGGHRLAAAGAGGGVGLQIVATGGRLALTEAEIIALAQAGQISGLALSLLYLARGHLHHICTDKNWVSDSTGGPWSPRFKDLFDDAEIGFDHPANLVEVEGHIGPHPQAYHDIVSRRLEVATRGVKPHTAAYRERVLRALRALGEEIRTPGSRLNKLVTGATRE